MDVDVVRGVLAQPTRARLVVLLRELREPMSTADLATKLDLHPNGVRLHLDRMAEVGIVVRSTEQRGRGRPRDMWSVAPDFAESPDPPTAYADLGRWLAKTLPEGAEGVRMAEEGGLRIGRELADSAVGDTPAEQLRDALASLGFQPVISEESDTKVAYRLCNCPYRDAVHERAQVICGLHKGVTRGLIEKIAPDKLLSAWGPKEPDEAGCIVEMSSDKTEE